MMVWAQPIRLILTFALLLSGMAVSGCRGKPGPRPEVDGGRAMASPAWSSPAGQAQAASHRTKWRDPALPPNLR